MFLNHNISQDKDSPYPQQYSFVVCHKPFEDKLMDISNRVYITDNKEYAKSSGAILVNSVYDSRVFGEITFWDYIYNNIRENDFGAGSSSPPKNNESSAMRIYGLAIMLCVFAAVGGCSEQKKNDPMADIRTSGASQRILDYLDIVLKKGKAKGVKTRDIIDDIAAVTNRVARGKLYKIVEDRLFSVDIDITPKNLYDQIGLMDGIWNSANYLAQNMVDATQEERWRIRLRALEWERNQILRIEKNEPPDVYEPVERKMIPVKVGNKVEYYPQ